MSLKSTKPFSRASSFVSSDTCTAMYGTNARHTKPLQSSPSGGRGELRFVWLNNELRDVTELWTGAVVEERR